MILVVDDFRDSAEVLARLLAKRGYPSNVAETGGEALARIRAHPAEEPLLVVLDEMMPEMSGIETLQAIRADPKIASAPVVFFTAGFDSGKCDTAMTLGALAWHYKGGHGSLDLDYTLKEIIRVYESVGGAKTASSNQPS